MKSNVQATVGGIGGVNSVAGHWLVQRWALCLAAVVFAGMAVPFVGRGARSEWQTCYVRAGERMLSGEPIHHIEPSAYAYPPLMAMLAVPFSWLSPHASLAVWYAINVAAMTAVVLGAWRLTAGPPMTGLRGRPAAALALAVLLSFRFLAAPLENQQFDVVIAALLLAGCLRLRQSRDLSAALWLGSAAAMKCTPLAFAGYLAWRGKLKSACLLVLVAVAWNRLPDVLFPQRSGGLSPVPQGTYLGDWMATYLIKVGREAPGAWESDLILNQSLAGLVNRFVQAGIPLSTTAIPSAQSVLTSATVRTIRWSVYGIGLVLAGVTAWQWGRPGRPRAPQATGGADPRVGLDSAMLVCLMLLLSPMSSKAHYVVLVLPIMFYARAVVESPAWRLRWMLVPLAIFGPLTSKGLTQKSLGDLTLCWGFPTLFAVVLLGCMLYLRACSSNARPEHGARGAPTGAP